MDVIDIVFSCTNCEKKVCVNGMLVGKRFRCPKCQERIQAPEPSMVFYCPECFAQFSAPAHLKDSSLLCPNCDAHFQIPNHTSLRCSECAVVIEIEGSDYLEFEGKDILCPECGADVSIPARPTISELKVDHSTGKRMPPGFGSKTLRLDEIMDNIPQAEQLRKGRCPYCGRPIWKMDKKSFACRNCGRLIHTVTSRV